MMNNFSLILNLLLRQFYGKYKCKDFVRIVIGLVVLAVLEVSLIKQAHINTHVLEQEYIIGALIFMNVYLTFLFVLTQWKEKFMILNCTLPISSRSFWLAEIVFIFIDTCLRRTLFFLILPTFLFIHDQLSVMQFIYWMGKFSLLTIYSVTVGILLGNLINSKKLMSLFIHIIVLTLIFLSILFIPVIFIVFCILHMCWIVYYWFSLFLRSSNTPHKKHKHKTTKGFSFYNREWNRFFSSKAMMLNYFVMIAFSTYFCYNLVHSHFASLTAVLPIHVALLLLCSPLALLYSIEKHNRILLLTLPLQKTSLFLQKYLFYIGLLTIGFLLMLVILSWITNESISGWGLFEGIELIITGCAIRLKVDERKPILDWQTEQKLWSDFRKYRSYGYCILLFLPLMLTPPLSNLCIAVVFVVVFYILYKQDGGFFE